jgi:hypothetical protein
MSKEVEAQHMEDAAKAEKTAAAGSVLAERNEIS